MDTGILYAASAFILWGLFPLYFKALHGFAPLEILAHRVVWSLVFLAIVLGARRQWAWLGNVRHQPRVLAGFAASAFLLSINWSIYIWAVNNDHIVDASLGYFVNPLINVLLGFLLLKERLRRGQWMAVGLAALGVAWLTWQGGHPPWIALALAITFGFYGLLRKTAMLGPLEGLSLETLVLFPVALGWLAWLTIFAGEHQNGFAAASTASRLLMICAGPLTTIPLLLFAAGARRISFSLLGLLQYISPTIQLLLGVWLYHEPFGGARLAGFAIIWSALALYSFEGALHSWARRPRAS
jgi:chloramphenicol-sensitive protein RarD